MSLRGSGTNRAKRYNHRSFRGTAALRADRVRPSFPSLCRLLALDARTTATYAADDSSLLFQASRGSEPTGESTRVALDFVQGDRPIARGDY